MITIADKAKAYAEEQIFKNRDILKEIKLETVEYLIREAYQDGYAEATAAARQENDNQSLLNSKP